MIPIQIKWCHSSRLARCACFMFHLFVCFSWFLLLLCSRFIFVWPSSVCRWNDRFPFASASFIVSCESSGFFFLFVRSPSFRMFYFVTFFRDANESLNCHKSRKKSSYSKIDKLFSSLRVHFQKVLWMAFATRDLSKCGICACVRWLLRSLCKYLFWPLSIHSIILVKSAQLTHKTGGCDKTNKENLL